MPKFRPTLLNLLLLTVVTAAGCLGVPAVPDHVAQRPRSASTDDDEDPYEGWLFRELTGQGSVRQTGLPDAPALAETNPGYGAQRLPGTPVAPEEEPEEDEEADDEARKKGWDGLDPDDFYLENVVKNAKAAVGFGPNKKIARTALEKGEALFRDERYEEAAKQLKKAAERWPDSTIEEDALFLLGECHFFSDQYIKAHDTYGKLLSNYSNTKYLDTAVHREFAIGRYWDQRQQDSNKWPIVPNVTDKTRPTFDTFGHAVQAYQRVRLHDPTGPLADDSIMAMANGYFVRGQFENAAWNYDLLRREYPDSKYQVEAHLLGLEAKKRVYQGARYDGTPLSEAEQIAEQAITQFNNELGPEKVRLARSRQQIIEEQATRDYAMGQYYETKRCYGAARFYYSQILEQFPESRTAEQARERLGAIQHQPDEPPNHLDWLTNILPGEKS